MFCNGPSNLPKNAPVCIVFDSWIYQNLISADELFEKALPILEMCLPVSNNSWGKWLLSLESPIILGYNLNITSV